MAAYNLVRGSEAVDDSAVIFRGYIVQDGHFKLADATGSDFDGYGLFVKELRSAQAGEIWILAWGSLNGFNGNKTRVRAYAFDGTKFRTLFSKNDTLNTSVSLTAAGFSLEYLDEERYYKVEEPPFYVHAEYAVSSDGVQLIPSGSNEGK